MPVRTHLTIPVWLVASSLPACVEDRDDRNATDTTDASSSSSASDSASTGGTAIDCEFRTDPADCTAPSCVWNDEHAACLPECGAIDDVLTCLAHHPCAWDGEHCYTGPI